MASILHVLNDPVLEKTLDVMLHEDRSERATKKKPGNAAAKTSAPNLPLAVPTAGWFDIMEHKEVYELVTDAPGFNPDDISVELHEGVLTITGKLAEEKAPAEQQQVKVLLRERKHQHFSRSFKLPDNAKTEEVVAHLDKGVLTVRVPKLPPPAKPEPRRIVVQSAPATAA